MVDQRPVIRRDDHGSVLRDVLGPGDLEPERRAEQDGKQKPDDDVQRASLPRLEVADDLGRDGLCRLGRRVDHNRVGGRPHRAHLARRVAFVALVHLDGECFAVPSLLRATPLRADLRARVEVDLQLGVGPDDRPDVTSFDDRTARRDELALMRATSTVRTSA